MKLQSNAHETTSAVKKLELRNKLTVQHNEPPISPQDERLLLVQSWLEESPGAEDIFEHWEKAEPRNAVLHAHIVTLLSSVLSLLSSHYTYHVLGHPITKTLLAPACIRRLNSYLGGTNNELISVTLKLYHALSTFAGGREQKSVIDAFPWKLKSLSRFANMRRKGAANDPIDPFSKPDIRTSYILFLLSFIHQDCLSQVKAAFLEQHREPFLSIFKGLKQDPYDLIRKILEVCWTGLWSDPKVKRTLKINLFNEITIGHLLKLYDSVESEDGNPDRVPADLVHHFLLAICTRPGTGICFKDRGWYPREVEGDEQGVHEDGTASRRAKIYNKILSNILKSLKVNQDPRQQELALKIMSACPELVAGYWPVAALTLEPRLSSRWLANIAFFGTVLSLPVPSSSFVLSDKTHSTATLYQPTPPPLRAILENILPSVNTKVNLTKGLQFSSSALVQHCSALALTNCLVKYDKVVQTFREIITALEEGQEEGQWSNRLQELEREIRRRVPDFQVVIAFSQHCVSQAEAAGGNAEKLADQASGQNPIKFAILAESAQRLLWMYHRSLPALVFETRFDIGKLLQGFLRINADDDKNEESGAVRRLDQVRRLHVLKLLKESDQFAWTGKSSTSSHSYLFILLKSLMIADNATERKAVLQLLQCLLSQTILFQMDADEPSLWLSALPRTQRSPDFISPDGATLTAEGDPVITFLDDCVQRCMKTPYKYLDEMSALKSKSDFHKSFPTPNKLNAVPSPLLMTVIEQLNAKVANGLLSPSDVLAIASFVRRVVINLASNLPNIGILSAIAEQIDEALAEQRLCSDFLVLVAAVRREVKILNASMKRLVLDGSDNMEVDEVLVSEEVQEFLDDITELPIPTAQKAQINTAYELVDWVRLVGEPLGPEGVGMILEVVKELHPPAVSAVVDHLDITENNLFDVMDVDDLDEFGSYISFQQLYLHADRTRLFDESCRASLCKVMFIHCPELVDLKRVLNLIGHGLSSVHAHQSLGNALLLLIADMVKLASRVLSTADFDSLKEFVYTNEGHLRSLLVSDRRQAAQDGLRQLMEATLLPVTDRNRTIVASICSHWLGIIKSRALEDDTHIDVVSLWIQLFSKAELFDLLDDLSAALGNSQSSTQLSLVKSVLSALWNYDTTGLVTGFELRRRLQTLLALRSILEHFPVLENLIAIAVEDSVPTSLALSMLDGDAPGTLNAASTVELWESRWRRVRQPLPAIAGVQAFFSQEVWTRSTTRILCGLMYRKMLSQDIFLTWMQSTHCKTRSPEDFIDVLHAFLDSTCARQEQMQDQSADPFQFVLERLTKAIVDLNLPSECRLMAGSCIRMISGLCPSTLNGILSQLSGYVRSLSVTTLIPELISVGLQIYTNGSDVAQSLVNALAEHGLQWLVRQLSENEDLPEHVKVVLPQLTVSISKAKQLKTQFVETLLTVTIQSQLKDAECLKLVTVALLSTHLKPVVVNRYLQSILQNAQFFKLCNMTGSTATREAIIILLFTLFNIHPSNTCQVTHVEPLIRVYRGTLSPPDLKLLSIFQLFEEERKLSVSPLLSRWSSSATMSSSSSLDAIQSLDANIVLRTCLHYPTWRRLENQASYPVDKHDSQLYDPMFLILLFGDMLQESPPSSTFAWVEMFRTNIVGLLIKSLSCKDVRVREIALCHITGLWKLLQGADMIERPHVLYIFSLMKDVYPGPSDGPIMRLPSYTTLLLLHALRGIFYPSNFIYPITARFLLQRPELDVTDVPMLYGMLYSSSDDWKKERGWMIRFLADGMMSADDWRVLKRRHTWDLLASLYQGSHIDHTLQKAILEVLANLTCHSQALRSLILKHSLLTWIQMQLLTVYNKEDLAWCKILANIVFLADAEKMESSTRGEWRSIICDCLSILVDSQRCDGPSLLVLITPIILKLSSLSGPDSSNLSNLLNKMLQILTKMEQGIDFPTKNLSIQTRMECPPFTLPPYTAGKLHEAQELNSLLHVWGCSIELLWQAAMNLASKPTSWDGLTIRLLLWRSIVGAEQSTIGEWARTCVLENIGNI
ncbi:hypothetical protein AMATHDRAFT_6373 [Amanita thiersii Skay4041]|uniref:Nucleolar pre-ribosomal-associated protein 1 C-terminal domain-containing protein n=1 Tax=Amanita thiersii Skay4041 TaxID=703135 RepID=A0A2A9NJC8_9AGAR|nr:hypothetical protein AMATHDRAFT_6373 [Amanita thiersii Skay4041]